MLDRTTTALIADIKRMGSIPNSQALYSDADFVAAMNDCQGTMIIPQIMRVREEFFVTHVDIPLVAGQRDYSIPERAIGSKVRQLILVDANGNDVLILPRFEPENRLYDYGYDNRNGYQFVGSKIRLTSTVDSTYPTLRIVYFRRPSELRLTTLAGQIESVSTTTGIIQLDKWPTGWPTSGTWPSTHLVDIHMGRPGFDPLADSVSVSAFNATSKSITVPLATAALLSVGDWVCDEGECVIPQYPVELHGMLANYALIDVLKHLGDTQGAQNAAADLQEQMNNFDTMISNRDEGAPRKVFSRRGLWNTGEF